MRGWLAAAALLVCAGPAAADVTLSAQPRDRYAADLVTIARGERLFFTNNDLDRHDVVGDGERPAFFSSVVGTAQTTEVSGAAALEPGRYGFHCSLHSFMQAALAVTGLTATVLTPTVEAARREIRVRVASWPAADVTVRARVGGAALAAVQRPVRGAVVVRVAVPAALRKRLRTAARLRIAVVAAAGDRTARAARTVSRGRSARPAARARR